MSHLSGRSSGPGIDISLSLPLCFEPFSAQSSVHLPNPPQILFFSGRAPKIHTHGAAPTFSALLLFAVPAEQELQSLCCHLLPAGGEAQVSPEQFPRGAARGRAAAPAQHHRRANRGQGQLPPATLSLIPSPNPLPSPCTPSLLLGVGPS